MARRTIVIMPGDGIGKVVLPEALRVLDAVGFEADYVHGDIGWDFWIKEGNALPEQRPGPVGIGVLTVAYYSGSYETGHYER